MIAAIDHARQLPDDPLVRVTEDGRVFKRINVHHPERRQWLEFKLQTDKDGYLYLRLGGRKWLIHRLVYSLFVGELLPGLVVCHRDGARKNNHWGNLLQATQLENISHKLQHGTHQDGENHPRAKHTADQIRSAKAALDTAARSYTGRIKRGEALRIAAETGCTLHTIHGLTSKQNWSSV